MRSSRFFVSVFCTGIIAGQSPNTFTSTGDMSTPRVGHTATLLTNGKVLIAGGSGPYSFTLPPLVIAPLGSAELYDPSSGTFTATGSMATSRLVHTATLLPNGKVLIAGGTRDISPVAGICPWLAILSFTILQLGLSPVSET